MMHHLWLGILFGLLLPCQSLAKMSEKECLQLAFQDSQKIENAIKGCYKQNEAKGRQDLLEILKDEVKRLTNEYDADVEKASRDLYDVSGDEKDMERLDSRDQNEIPSDEKDMGGLDSRDQNEVLSDQRDIGELDEKDMRQLDSPDSKSKDPFWRGRRSYSRRRRVRRRRSFFRRRSRRRRRWIRRRRSIRRRRFIRRRRSIRRRRFIRRRRSIRRRRFIRRRRSRRRRRRLIRIFPSIRRRTWRRRKAGRPGKPIINGCSVPLKLPFLFKKTFTPSCRKHDICYYREFYSRLSCDNKFRDDMRRSCSRFGRWKRFTCLQFARIYYTAVRVGGKRYYG